MTTPEAEAKPEVRLADETMEYLHRQMRKAVREGIADALHQAITLERAREFFVVGVEVLREEASKHTGQFVLDALMAAAKRLFWIGLFVLAVYSFGGWSLVKTLAAAIFGGSK